MTKGKVLVIDDSPTVRRLVEVVLSEEGYKVYSAEDGEDGLEMAKKVLPSIILVDFMMPKLNGYQFCKKLEESPALREVPIIVITAKGVEVGARFAEKFGRVCNYFIKPFQPEELVERVNSILKPQKEEAAVPETKKASESAPTGHIKEIVEREIRGFFYEEFPALLQRNIMDILKHAGVIKESGIDLSGNLANFSLLDIFQLIDVARLTGRLYIYSPSMSSEIYFDKGIVVYATTSRQENNIVSGRLVARGKMVPEQTFNNALKKVREAGGPILKGLINEGVLSEEEGMAILEDCVTEAIYSTMELEKGTFFFEKLAIPDSLLTLPIRLRVSQFILEGVRRVDERRFAAKLFQDNTRVFIRLLTDVAMQDINLDRNELKIFSLVDGRRTLGDIIQVSGIDDREAKRIFYTLTRVGILKEKAKTAIAS